MLAAASAGAATVDAGVDEDPTPLDEPLELQIASDHTFGHFVEIFCGEIEIGPITIWIGGERCEF